MAIGLGAAALGSAVIGAGANLIGGSKQSKAARDVANTTAADNAANRQFLQGIYNQNVGYLSPWMRSGQTADSAFMELLGFPAQPSAFPQLQTPTGTPVSGTPQGGMTSAFAYLPNDMAIPRGFGVGDSLGGYGARNAMGARNLQRLAASQGVSPVTAPTITGQPVSNPVTAPSARSAFDTYRGSTGYDFRFNEGMRALQSAFSRNLESGAATKAAMRFGQGIASDEFGRYMDLLRGQSQLGLSGASALAGVGQNFGNTVVAGNQAATSAAANARLYAGQSQANMWGNLGSSFGGALGYLVK